MKFKNDAQRKGFFGNLKGSNKYKPLPESKPRYPPEEGKYETRWGVHEGTGIKVLLHRKRGTKQPWHPIGQEHNGKFGH